MSMNVYCEEDFEFGCWVPNYCPDCGHMIKDKDSFWKCSTHGIVRLPLSRAEEIKQLKTDKELFLWLFRHTVLEPKNKNDFMNELEKLFEKYNDRT